MIDETPVFCDPAGMCNLITMANPTGQLAKELVALGLVTTIVGGRYSIGPGADVPTVLHDGAMKLTTTRWGLVPRWAKDETISKRTYNARSETLREKPSFRDSYRHRRCLILADGFYEFQKIRGRAYRQPVYFRLRSREVFAFAGLWDSWVAPDGSDLVTSTIITTRPNSLMKPIHHRMPVILPVEQYQAWLDRGNVTAKGLDELLKPFDAAAMECFEVSPNVDRSQVDGPECIEPAKASPNHSQLDLFGSSEG